MKFVYKARKISRGNATNTFKGGSNIIKSTYLLACRLLSTSLTNHAITVGVMADIISSAGNFNDTQSADSGSASANLFTAAGFSFATATDDNQL